MLKWKQHKSFECKNVSVNSDGLFARFSVVSCVRSVENGVVISKKQKWESNKLLEYPLALDQCFLTWVRGALGSMNYSTVRKQDT